MKTTSLTRQALATVLIAELLCAVALSCVAVLHERHVRFRAFDVMLPGRSDSLLGAVQDAEDPDDNVAIDPTELRLPADDVFAVYNQGGRLLGTSLGAPATLIARGSDGLTDRTAGGRRYRVLQREALRIFDREESGGAGLRRPVTIIYGARTRHVGHKVLEAAGYSAVITLVLLCTTTALLSVRLKHILQPLDDLAIAAGAISTGSLEFCPRSRPSTLRIAAAGKRLVCDDDAASRSVRRPAPLRRRRHISIKNGGGGCAFNVQPLSLRPRSQEEYQSGLIRVLDDNSRVEELVSRMLMLARVEERGTETVEVGPLIEVPALIGLVNFAFWMRRRYFNAETPTRFQVRPVEDTP